MTGHDFILKLRRMGKSPAVVRVVDFPSVYLDKGHEVHMAAGETPELQDWRFVVGLTVIVEGEDGARLDRIAAAVTKYAKRTLVTQFERTTGPDGFRVCRITDTAGVMTWPA